MSAQKGGVTGADIQTRIAATQVRISRLSAVKDKLRKLNIHLANIAVAERPQQLKLVKSARNFIAAMREDPVNGTNAILRVLDNELISFNEGITSRAVKMSDLVLLSGVEAVNTTSRLIVEAGERLSKLQAEQLTGNPVDTTEREIALAREELAKIPDFGDKTFQVARAPIVFTSQNKGETKFSKVGYISPDQLDRLGFKAGLIGDYAVIKRQLVIGINPHNLLKEKVGKDEEGNSTTTKVRRKVEDTKQVNKGGKPQTVTIKRELTPMDEAIRVKGLMEKRTGVEYTFLSPKGTSYKRGTWFWLMPTSDVRRFAKAFPGGRADIQTWGMAGAQS